MEWLNTPQNNSPRDICPIYICGKRKSDNEGGCVVYVCGTQWCINDI